MKIDGKAPFERWHDRLSNLMQRAVDARLTRIAAGNFGDHKSGEGGDKSSQKQDIKRARAL